ncbi:MAG: hypothetical protein U0514_01110 [Candidatus Andersenbacteria bacterium]
MKRTPLIVTIVAATLLLIGGAGLAIWLLLAPHAVVAPESTSNTTGHTSGTYTAFIASYDGAATALRYDENTWTTGDAAKQAALAAGECTKLADCTPDGFFVANPEVRIDHATLASNVKITVYTKPDNSGLYTGGTGVVALPISLADFATFLDRPDRNKNTTYELTFQSDGSISDIHERYQP